MDETKALKKIAVRDLRLGMYIHIPLSWDAHPFLRNKFLVDSPSQIRKIVDAGITELLIDPKKSKTLPESAVRGENRRKRADHAPGRSPGNPTPHVAPEKLLEAIHDPKLPAPEKSKIVHDNA
ncbi:MAG: DUF3391 domain-containing protein, partial [Deltaproteobacteria bacterium]|nr:DUF3391 domain-containing protein [Deltaproteobacteria bacterium]